MKRAERMQAFEMRLEGKGWSAIGRALGYSGNAVKQDLIGCVLSKPRQIACAYPAIRAVIEQRYGGCIKTFAEACGISYNAMYYTLSGRCFVPQDRQARICEVIGLAPAEAFEREED